MSVGSQIYVTLILALQLLAEFTTVTRSEKKNERNINAVMMVLVALAIFMIWS